MHWVATASPLIQVSKLSWLTTCTHVISSCVRVCVCVHVDCSLADREKCLQNAINAMYRFDSDLKDFNLWLTKVGVVLGRYTEMTSELTGLDSAQRGQISDALRVST